MIDIDARVFEGIAQCTNILIDEKGHASHIRAAQVKQVLSGMYLYLEVVKKHEEGD